MAKKTRERKPDVQWFKSRLRALGLQIKDAAEVFDLPPNKVWQMLAARRRVQPEELAIWAKLLRAPMSTIFKRMDYPWESGAAVVDGIVSTTGVITWREHSADGAAARIVAPYPEGGNGELHALMLEAPAAGFGRGTLFYFEPYDRVDRACFGRLAVITRGAGLESYLGVAEVIDEGRATVTSIGGRPVDLTQIVSATPIKWIRTRL